MIIMLDTSHKLKIAEAELNYPVEQLLTPLTRFRAQHPEDHFAIDNGSYSKFNEKGFRSLLSRHRERIHLCRFVAVPDVVGNAEQTLARFEAWHEELKDWPLAFLCQDGQERLPLPWDKISAIFIGGSTEWKESDYAIACIKEAQQRQKWTHVGRVNTRARFEGFKALGVDSIDGSGISRYSYMRYRIGHPSLFK